MARAKETKMTDVVIVAAGRTAIGKFGGTLAKIPAADLWAHVIKGVLARAGVEPDQVSEVIMGQILTAGIGMNGARQAAIRAGVEPGRFLEQIFRRGENHFLAAIRMAFRGDTARNEFRKEPVAALFQITTICHLGNDVGRSQ